MREQTPVFTTELRRVGSNNYSLTISATTFVKGVHIEFDREDVEVDDNFFDVDAGISKTVVIVSQRPEEIVTKRITLRSVWS